MLGDLYVYGKSRAQSTLVVSDKDLRDRDAQYIVREALQGKLNSATAFNIDFAPQSSVMTASGRHKVEIIAAAMAVVNQKLGFTIHVIDKSTEKNQNSLNQNRARAIVSHMQVKQPIANKLIIGEKNNLPLALISTASNKNTQNVIFESLGEPRSQLSVSK